jgi:hypothetical protein
MTWDEAVQTAEWDPYAQVLVLLEYVNSQNSPEAFGDFLAHAVEETIGEEAEPKNVGLWEIVWSQMTGLPLSEFPQEEPHRSQALAMIREDRQAYRLYLRTERLARRRLTSDQRGFLQSLLSYRRWSADCGWHWNNPSTTRRLIDSLVARGLVERVYDAEGKPEYYPVRRRAERAVHRRRRGF